jgi:hypothetical protein
MVGTAKQEESMGLEKLQEFITTPSEADTALINSSQTPQLSLVRPEQSELDVLLQELADIIESEVGILIP